MNEIVFFDLAFYIFAYMIVIDWVIHLTQTMPTIRRHRKTSFVDWLFTGPHQIRNLNDYKKYLTEEGAPLTWFYVRQGILFTAVIAILGFLVSIFALASHS